MSEDEEIAETVRKYGYQNINIFDADPPFVYTVGLSTTFQHPEAIVFGLPGDIAARLFSDFVNGLREGLRFDKDGVYSDAVFACPIGIRVVHESQHTRYFGYAMGYCRRNNLELAAIQVFWPDKDNRFPFDANCEERVYLSQPRIDIQLTSEELEEDRWMNDL